jgi:hypothetical protein
MKSLPTNIIEREGLYYRHCPKCEKEHLGCIFITILEETYE